MKRILDEIFYGNIIPNEAAMKRGSEYSKTTSLVTECEAALNALLNEEANTLFKKYQDTYSDLLSIASCEYWKMGFCMGLRIGMEITDEAAADILPVGNERS